MLKLRQKALECDAISNYIHCSTLHLQLQWNCALGCILTFVLSVYKAQEKGPPAILLPWECREITVVV